MKFTPLRVTLIYLGIAVLWILTSDYAAQLLTDDFLVLSRIQTYKGVFYVCMTAVVLYMMMKSYENFIAKKEKEFETLIHDTSAGMAVLNNQIIESCNQSFDNIFKSGITEGKTNITDFIHREDKKRFIELLEHGETVTDTWESSEFRFNFEKNETVWV
ncbi:MAG: PAS domain-containing protein, partial [Balneolaceae bacterium]